MTHTGTVTVTVWRVSGSDPRFDDVVALFDAYRQHYGANPAPAAAARWLLEHGNAGRLQIFAAGCGAGAARGLLTVSVVPASLTLRTAWLIRDLYVDPGVRRRGMARALLSHVAAAAGGAGAHRLSLQTEVHNAGALGLYAEAGFEAVTDLTLLNLALESP